MCTLGRIEPESPDRQFLDANVLDILRSEGLVAEVANMHSAANEAQWKQSLGAIGLFHFAQMITLYDLDRQCFSYLKKYSSSRNTRKLGEIVSGLTVFGHESLDFQGLQLTGANFPILNLNKRTIKNFVASESEVGVVVLDATPITVDCNFQLVDCIFSTMAGISNKDGIPLWIKNPEVISFEPISNAARIKESMLSGPQKLFLSIVHKIFFQAGGGREEASLLKGGYGQKFSPKLADSIIKILIREGIVVRRKGDDGWVYTPVRRYTDRLNKIRAELTLSDDPIWLEVNGIRHD